MKTNIEKIKLKTLPVLKKNNVTRAGIFGSYARGDNKKNSDVDILIKFRGRKSLLDLARLELEKVLEMKVDLLTYKGIHHPLLKERILKEEVKIL
ncbi:MAG: nucleotidyltransferase family protein [Nanoarchaeota archaeon]|nr:nucleotidyltransferase family protein [Nanoarchaeota archaeon]